jgi:phosphatidylglycerol lysyltransferase
MKSPEAVTENVDTPSSRIGQRLLAGIGPALGLVLLVAAASILRREFHQFHLDEILTRLHSIPTGHLLRALGLTVVGYGVLTGYDTLAFRYVANPLPYRRIALSSFVAYVFSHNIGLSFFGGSAVRFRMLSGWGVKADDIARVVAFVLLTFWMGFFFLGGVLNTLAPVPITIDDLPLTSSRPIGWMLLTVALAYVALTLLRNEPLVVRGFRIGTPRFGTTIAQFMLSTVDWLVAASVLYAVLPDAPGLSFPTLVSAYMLAQVVGIVSHVPGGLGVFETAMVLLLKPWLGGPEVLASVLAYRFVYYLLPLGAAILLFAGYEVRERSVAIRRTGVWLQGWMAEFVPRLFATTTFLAGGLLVLSGAMPEWPDRLMWLRKTLPLPVIEMSKLLGSVAGVLLLVLANALRQRIDAAYLGTLVLLTAGASATLARGFDWEDALALVVMAILLLPCRSFFYRKSSLLGQSFSLDWWFGVLVVAAGSLATLDLAYRHVEYTNELWWHFAPAAAAPRSLRAMLAAGVVALGVGGLRLLRPVPPLPSLPDASDLDQAQAIAARSPQASGHLAMLGDKELLFHDDGNAFLMYGISGRTWVAMGDPIGSEDEQEELAWRFRELADRHGAHAVFYEVSEQSLPIYLDLGLRLLKLGEEGRVPLADFSLEGSARRDFRQADNRLTREGCQFAMVPASEVAPLLDELEAISNSWLSEKNAREKRFSLGFFDRSYLVRYPVAVVRKDARIIAFANVWPSETRFELTIDLMRYSADAPTGVMEYLFAELMLWGRDQGYQYFGLGMAPLSGFEQHRLAPRWNRLGALLFRHGEHFYNFQGLRSFKDKFHPEWEPRYLASQGGLSTALVLTRIAALVSGGVTGIVTR